MTGLPALRPLHADSTLIRTKLAFIERQSTEALLASLAPGQQHCLKCRADGTMLDGHHRVYILRQRGIEVDRLPRETHDSGDDKHLPLSQL